MIVYEYLERGEGVLTTERPTLDKKVRAKLDVRIRMIGAMKTREEVEAAGFVGGSHEAGVSKVQIRGNVALRPLVCFGVTEIDGRQEEDITFLLFPVEKDRKLPKGSEKEGARRKEEVRNDASRKQLYHQK